MKRWCKGGDAAFDRPATLRGWTLFPPYASYASEGFAYPFQRLVHVGLALLKPINGLRDVSQRDHPSRTINDWIDHETSPTCEAKTAPPVPVHDIARQRGVGQAHIQTDKSYV